jgi:ABC-type sugar transport system ATPase subunit
MKRINEKGIAIILISHNMPQVLEVTHRVMVLRHGQRAGVVRTAETDVEQVVRLITGAEVQTAA